MPSTDENDWWLAEARRASDALELAEAELATRLEGLGPLVQEARDAGMLLKPIARHLGITVREVGDLLAPQGPGDPNKERQGRVTRQLQATGREIKKQQGRGRAGQS
jgi:hypothetical protein